VIPDAGRSSLIPFSLKKVELNAKAATGFFTFLSAAELKDLFWGGGRIAPQIFFKTQYI
jgi:hypothetical protein